MTKWAFLSKEAEMLSKNGSKISDSPNTYILDKKG
jgi:hypothetical protein